MTRSLQRQLEEETDLEKNLGFDPKQLKRDFEKELDASTMLTPRDDDTYSPLHDEDDEIEAETAVGKRAESEATDEAHGDDADGVKSEASGEKKSDV